MIYIYIYIKYINISILKLRMFMKEKPLDHYLQERLKK